MIHFGLIGFPLSHSFSGKYFTEKFKNENITNCSYHLFPIEDISSLPKMIREQKNLMGLTITYPYKEKVLKYIDKLDPTAKDIGAVNTIKIIRRHNPSQICVEGYNTDAAGFSESVRHLTGSSMHPNSLVLGTGGAAKAVIYGLKKLGFPFLQVSRSPKNGQLNYDDLYKYISDYTLIINCTPLGMYPEIETYPDIPYEMLTEDHLLFDLTYNPAVTRFLKKGQKYGASIKNGLEMLHLQADKAWELWNS